MSPRSRQALGLRFRLSTLILVASVSFFSACLSHHASSDRSPAVSAPPRGPVWKVALLAGDDSIDVFDNAREDLGRKLFLLGVAPENLVDLSMASPTEPTRTWAASVDNLRAALRSLKIGPRDACLLHLTSHGSPEGFFLGDDPSLTPEVVSALLDQTCGKRPTVVLVSACYTDLGDANERARYERVC